MRFYFTTTNSTLGVWAHREPEHGARYGEQLFRCFVSAYSDGRPTLNLHAGRMSGGGWTCRLPFVPWRYRRGVLGTAAWEVSNRFWCAFRRLAARVQKWDLARRG